jgi:hypothetical protein
MTLPGRRTLRQRKRRRRIRRGATIVVLVAIMVWITPGTAEAAGATAPRSNPSPGGVTVAHTWASNGAFTVA